jgi:IS30 family transposase
MLHLVFEVIPFDRMTDEALQAVARKLNNRPRKCLAYKTPFEVVSQEYKKQGVALRV